MSFVVALLSKYSAPKSKSHLLQRNKYVFLITCITCLVLIEIRQSHTTIAVVEKHSDGTYVLKALKQKLFVDGLCYLLQEIYGIENKNLDTKVSYGDQYTCHCVVVNLIAEQAV